MKNLFSIIFYNKESSLTNFIFNILKECDDEFFPPLSYRNSTITKSLKNKNFSKTKEPIGYFQEVLKQINLIALIDNKPVGLLSFRNKFKDEILTQFSPCNYVSTICVSNSYRRLGIAKRLYEYLINYIPYNLKCKYISTRTWSTNISHINLLKKLNFKLIYQLHNHRGEGIHTVYYVKKI